LRLVGEWGRARALEIDGALSPSAWLAHLAAITDPAASKLVNATEPQRQALIVRDRRCGFPSCNRRSQWCDVHHITGWVKDLGETNIDNLVLLCRRHHTLLHNGQWTITRADSGGFEFTHPARGP
jgi:hypothetical protein